VRKGYELYNREKCQVGFSHSVQDEDMKSLFAMETVRENPDYHKEQSILVIVKSQSLIFIKKMRLLLLSSLNSEGKAE